MSLYAQLCCPEFLLQAWKRVECRKGMAGTDGQTIDAFRRDRDRNVTRISDSLKNGTYAPSPLRGVKISKNGGGFRRLGVPTVKDRIVFQGANRLLADVWDPLFAPLSFAYRSGRSIADAIDAVIERIRKGRVWFVKGDIKGCFDELSWDVLSACLHDWLPDESLRRLVNQAIRVPVVEGGQIRPRLRGIPQGSPLSPLLANLYLHSFDLQMLQQGFPVIRYADDWLLLVGSEPEAPDRAGDSLRAEYRDQREEKRNWQPETRACSVFGTSHRRRKDRCRFKRLEAIPERPEAAPGGKNSFGADSGSIGAVAYPFHVQEKWRHPHGR